MNKSIQNVVKTVVFISLGVGLFVWTIQSVGLSEILSEIKQANIWWVFLALISGLLSHYSRAVRWKLLIDKLDHKANTWNSFHSVIIGYFVNLAIPRLGEITRPATMSKLEGVSFNKLIGTVVAERVIDMVMMLFIGLAIVLMQLGLIKDTLLDLFGFYLSINPVFIAVSVIVPAIFIAILIYKKEAIFKGSLMQKVRNFLLDLYSGFKTVFQLDRKWLFIFHTVFIWIMYFCMPYFILKSLDATAHLGITAALTVLFFGTVAVIIPVPGGIGTFHALVPIALTLYQINELSGKAYATLTHAIQTVLVLVFGVVSAIYIFVKLNKQKKNEHKTAD